MKVLALNSSPRVGADSKTEWMLDHLLQGMADAGAAVEAVVLKDRKIKLCRGCFTCWTKTPGTCILKDDMTSELLPKWMAADLVVYASPLYHYTFNAQMKAFIERTLPILEPFLEEGADNRTDHSLRSDPPGRSGAVGGRISGNGGFRPAFRLCTLSFSRNASGGNLPTGG